MNPEDNAYDDQSHSGRRLRPRPKSRKRFAIECKLEVEPGTIMSWGGLDKWWIWGRYLTESRRDQAYAALVKKANSQPGWRCKWIYRKRNN